MSAGKATSKRETDHPKVNDVRDLLTFRLAAISAACDRLGQQWLAEEYDLRIMEWRVLGVAAAISPVRFADLSRTLLMDKGQLSRIVRSLTDKGLTTVAGDPGDRRVLVLDLSGEGRALHDRILARARERNDRVTAALSRDELRTLFGLLDKLQPYMSERADAAGPR